MKPDFFLPIPEASQLGNLIEVQVLYIRVSVLGTPEKPLRGCDKFSTGKTTSKDVKTFTAAALCLKNRRITELESRWILMVGVHLKNCSVTQENALFEFSWRIVTSSAMHFFFYRENRLVNKLDCQRHQGISSSNNGTLQQNLTGINCYYEIYRIPHIRYRLT